MSCETLIKLSHDIYPVGRVHLVHFQLKLSLKNRYISNDYDNTKNVRPVKEIFKVTYYGMGVYMVGVHVFDNKALLFEKMYVNVY